MQDRQAPSKSPTGNIPVISPVLHCLAMPALVFLRHGFGYSFLSPKSIFLSCGFSAVLLSYVVWHDDRFRGFYGLSVFALAASSFYVLHLIRAVTKLQGGEGDHLQFSGKSLLLDLLPGRETQLRQGAVRCFAEPAVVILAGWLASSNALGRVLTVAGVSLALKECIRAWLAILLKRKVEDNLLDAKDTMESVQPSRQQPVTATGKTARERYQRKFVEADPAAEHAKELRLMPPYTLEQAEKNYSELVAGLDPETPAREEQMKILANAIAYFRTAGS